MQIPNTRRKSDRRLLTFLIARDKCEIRVPGYNGPTELDPIITISIDVDELSRDETFALLDLFAFCFRHPGGSPRLLRRWPAGRRRRVVSLSQWREARCRSGVAPVMKR